MTPQQLVQAGLEHHRQGRRSDAQSCFRQAVAIDPNSHVALFMLGVALLDSGQSAEAADVLSAAIKLFAGAPEYHNALGVALARIDRFSQAAAAYTRAAELRPNYFDARLNLGQLLLRMNESAAAAQALRHAVALRPDSAPAGTELANALRECGQLDEAEQIARRALQIDPQFAWGRNILGLILFDRGQSQEAMAEFRQAITLKPDFAEVYLNIAQAHWTAGQLMTAIDVLKHAAAIAPNDARAQHNLGVVLSDAGINDEAIARFRHALSLRPTFVEAHSALLLTLNYHPSVTPRQKFEEHVEFGRRHAPSVTTAPFPPRSPGRIRVGYVSVDFRQHPVSSFIESLLAAHDKEQFEIFCYSDVARPDAVTARLKTWQPGWRDIAGVGHAQVCDLVRRDGIDILVDLGGHTRRSRLPLFAARPAPVQVNYLGYPNTTGLAQMDYRLTDAHADPPGESDLLHTEKLIRLPHGFLCYRPPADCPSVQPRSERPITFASFNNLAKLTPQAIGVWSHILRSVPASRLLLKNRSLGDEQVAQMIAGNFAAHGISSDRLDLRPPAPTTAEHLAIYNEVDIGLDTFPYNGTTTTCEALWMAVPVVTFTGDTHAARVGASILHQVNLPDLIGSSADDYARIAIELAGDQARLAELRAGMRQRLLASPLLNARLITGDIEAEYQRVASR